MRRMLLGTTALAAAGLVAASPGLAAEKLKVGIGGYMEQWVGFANNDDSTVISGDRAGEEIDAHTIGTVTDSEVHFKGSTTLDNGITVSVQIELEGNTSGDQIDESYIRVGGGFGQFVVGSENSAMYAMHYGVPDFGIGLNSGDLPNWANWGPSITASGYWRQPLGSTNVEPAGTNDSEKITYFTPRIEGFQLGLSYGPDNAEAGGIQDKNDRNHDLFSVGLNFNRSFDAASVQVSGGYGTIQNKGKSDEDPSAYNVGVRIGVGGFGVAAAYSNFDDSGAKTGEGYSVGASYSSGPWGISIAYFDGEAEGTIAATAVDNNLDDDVETTDPDTWRGPVLVGHRAHQTVHLSAKYALGPGITAAGTLGFAKLETDDTQRAESTISAADAAGLATTPRYGAENEEGDASYFVVGLKISF